MRLFFLAALCWLATSSAFAAFTLHVQSPWKDDPVLSANELHLLGAANSQYNAGASSKMTSEGNGWYSYTFDASITGFSYHSLTVKSCALSNGNNYSCTAWTAGGKVIEPKANALFGPYKEVWLYTAVADSPYYKVELNPQGSRYVWFKSPWGNKTLPQVIVGADTMRMRAAPGDAAHCGWFYGAIRPGMGTDVYFHRPHTRSTLPAQGTLAVGSLLGTQDSVYVDGTASSLAIASSLGEAGACFDSSRTLHVLSPWRKDSQRRSMPVFATFGGNLPIPQDTALSNTGELEYWWRYDIPDSLTRLDGWVQNYATVQFRSHYPTKGNNTLYYKLSPKVPALFPEGEYEVWLMPKGDSLFEVLHTPIHARYIQFLNPWSATTPSSIWNGDTTSMGKVGGKCGWYQTRFYTEPASWDVLFKQTIGKEIYTASGLQAGAGIALDSVFALGDSAWVMPSPYPSGVPSISMHFPEQLADCGERELAVMVLDWLGEGEDQNGGNTIHSNKSGYNNVDPDFGFAYDGDGGRITINQKTYNGKTYNGCKTSWDGKLGYDPPITGMVEPVLGANGVPKRNTTSFPDTLCTSADHLDEWFVPKVVKEAGGQKYTNATCYDMPLALDDEGFWVADYYEDEKAKVAGFFPVDDFKYLDSAKTVLNPKWDSVDGGWRGYRNYSFSMVVQAEFEYVKGQYFEFRGDDDVWVFINKKLVVDIGGVHGPTPGSVKLDTIGDGDGEHLAEGNKYPFHIFFAERNAQGSNFKMRTSMDLQTQRNYFPVEKPSSDGLISYEVWQILKEKSLACNFNGSADEKVDTIKAPSIFTLFGAQFTSEGVKLKSGLNYGGITISEGFTTVTIDTTAIVRVRGLAPGLYTLVFTNAVDASLTTQIRFSVPAYPMPSISFADSLGNLYPSNSLVYKAKELYKYANTRYAVYVVANYAGAPCDYCNDELNLSTGDSLVFMDSSRSVISSITLDSGKAVFWVMGKQPVESASFGVRGLTVSNELLWSGIRLERAPVPTPVGAMYDRNADGVPDSLRIAYDRPLKGNGTLHGMQWVWGDVASHAVDSASAAAAQSGDSSQVFVADSLVKFIATGGSDDKNAYAGSVNCNFTYIDSNQVEVPFEISGIIADSVAPLLTSAQIAPGSKFDTLSLTLSESISEKSGELDSLLQFRAWRKGAEVSAQAVLLKAVRRGTGFRYDLLLDGEAAVALTVGDSVKLVEDKVLDISGNKSRAEAPWVRIVGKQRSSVQSPGPVVLNLENAGEKAPVVTVVRVPVTQDVQDAADALGLPGHLIRFDLGNYMNLDSTLVPADIELGYDSYYFTNLGQYMNHSKGTISCADTVFNGDCSLNPGNLYLAWNARSEKGRLAATGAYVALLDFQVKVRGKGLAEKSDKAVWGLIRR